MAAKHLSDFYTYKSVLESEVRRAQPSPEGAEEYIRAHLLAGNQAFFKGRYRQALNEYLAAFGWLAELCEPSFPSWTMEQTAANFAGIDLTEHLAGTSAAILKYRD